ncbi:MAG TPA: hypothetical protein VKU44_10615 [Terriglobia bacterium]|nr:hypothetical protein [Terriglobia bacterium]
MGNGGSLTHAGELDLNHGATLRITATSSTAMLAIKPGSGATCKLNFNNVGTGTSALVMSGASNSAPAVLAGDRSGGGANFVMVSPGGGTMPTWSLTNAKLAD